jgi:opacity protein-like surface antigen
VGFAYLSLSIPPGGRVNLHGVDATFTGDLTEHFGLRADFSYTQASRTLSYHASSQVTTFLAGPVAYLARKKSFSLYTEGLLGGARVDTTVPTQGGALTGYVTHFAFAVGAGVQYHFTPSISFRLGADYLHTEFAQSPTALQGQSNLRAVASVVYRFGT